jgi:hypothetical protein
MEIIYQMKIFLIKIIIDLQSLIIYLHPHIKHIWTLLIMQILIVIIKIIIIIVILVILVI